MAAADEKDKYSITLFSKDDGSGMKFYMKPCEMKARIRPMVEVSLWYFRKLFETTVTRVKRLVTKNGSHVPPFRKFMNACKCQAVIVSLPPPTFW